jgi:lipocalin
MKMRQVVGVLALVSGVFLIPVRVKRFREQRPFKISRKYLGKWYEIARWILNSRTE